MKRILAVILALALVLSCAAALAEGYPLVDSPAEFNLIIRVRPLHGDPDEMVFFKNLEELTGVHINWQKIQQAEYDEKKNLLLAANKDLPDGFFGKFSLSSSDLVVYGSQGILIPLNDLIDQYAPNIKALLERRPDIKSMITAPDGNIYSTPYVQEGEDGTIASNIMINMTWLERLGLDYIDLMLIHQSGSNDTEVYKALCQGVRDGKLRSIGISNYYTPDEYERVTSGGEIKPAVVQNENHPFYQNTEFQKDIAKYGTVVESWYPFGGRGHTQDLFGNDTIMDIAETHGKTSAQIILRWHLQAGYVTIPGSQNPDHILENYSIFDFELTDAEMQRMMFEYILSTTS